MTGARPVVLDACVLVNFSLCHLTSTRPGYVMNSCNNHPPRRKVPTHCDASKLLARCGIKPLQFPKTA